MQNSGHLRDPSFVMSYRLGIGGISQGMTHYDREGGGGGSLKDRDIMVKCKQETHKKGEVLAWKYNNSTILL